MGVSYNSGTVTSLIQWSRQLIDRPQENYSTKVTATITVKKNYWLFFFFFTLSFCKYDLMP